MTAEVMITTAGTRVRNVLRISTDRVDHIIHTHYCLRFFFQFHSQPDHIDTRKVGTANWVKISRSPFVFTPEEVS